MSSQPKKQSFWLKCDLASFWLNRIPNVLTSEFRFIEVEDIALVLFERQRATNCERDVITAPQHTGYADSVVGTCVFLGNDN